MFKRVIQSLSKSLSRQPATPTPPKPAPAAKTVEAAPAKPQPQAAAPAAKATKSQTPEEICGITPKMSKEQIRDELKILYRRFNRAASSLDAKTRAEAELMLDAIVTVREKHLGSI
ncbi:MAG: hypothetical protein JNJ83_05800 [Verrucomicrobiaceae bacterium]|nr:hypothetical protein [Verrucomicrobiaceae bacterium]